MKVLGMIPWLLLIVIGGIICLPLLVIGLVIEAITGSPADNYHRNRWY